MMLAMIGRFGMNGGPDGSYQAVEFCGEAVAALGMAERMTLANMSAELGAQAGLVAPDEVTRAYLRDAGVEVGELSHWQTDPGAEVERMDFDAAALAPQVAAPHSPANAGDVGRFTDRAVDVAYIGACTGAKLDDLRMAAAVLRGRRVAAGTRLIVAPASRLDQDRAEREGLMQVLRDAGAQVGATACGACAGYGDTLADARTVISSTARNFRGRMGSTATDVYLASPATVAASAVAGRICDPRDLLRAPEAAA
jgi:3-isopropylmalate/(R)-2-methylmalate dehydratase large subunit